MPPVEIKANPLAPAGNGSAGSGSAHTSGSASSRPRRKAPEVVVPPAVAPVVAPPLSAVLSSSAQSAGYDSVKGKIKACAEAKGVKGPLSVYVSIEVMPSGKVRQARVTSGNDASLTYCVSSILIHAVFEPTQQGGTFRKIYVQE
jgi:hypothetical protein